MSSATTENEKPPVGLWKLDIIEEDRRSANTEFFANATREELMERIITLEKYIHPFVRCMGGLDDKPDRSMSATSDLFPVEFESTPDGHVEAYNSETGKLEQIKWHEKLVEELGKDKKYSQGYTPADSVTIKDGSLLPDTFQVLAVHESALCAYVSHGAISMGDIRLLLGAFYPESKYAKLMAAEKVKSDV